MSPRLVPPIEPHSLEPRVAREPLRDLRRIGDPTRRITRRRGLNAGLLGVGGGTFAQALAGYGSTQITTSLLAGGSPFSLEPYVSLPLWVGATSTAAGIGYSAATLRARQRLTQQLELQDEIRRAFGREPVDLWVERKRSSSVRLRIRWYGADGQTKAPSHAHLVRRLERLIQQGADEGVSSISVGTLWVETLLAREGRDHEAFLAEHGALSSGRRVRVRGKVIEDSETDARILTMTLDKAAVFTEALRTLVIEDASNRLIALIQADAHRSASVAAYQKYQSLRSEDSRLALIRSLQAEIAEILDSDAAVEAFRPEGAGPSPMRTRMRTNTTTTITDRMITSFATGRSPSSGAEFSLARPSAQLLHQVGATSVEELEASIFNGRVGASTGLRARTALYTRLLNDGTPAANATTPGFRELPRPLTLFERMGSETPRTFPVLRARGRSSAAPTLRYGHQRSRLLRSTLATLSLSAALVGGSELGDIASYGTSRIVVADYDRYQEEQDASVGLYSDEGHERSLHAYRIYENGGLVRVLDAYMALNDAGYAIQQRVEQGLLDRLPSSLPTEFLRGSYQPTSGLEIPQRDVLNAYTVDEVDTSMSFGDNPLSDESRAAVVYDIDPLAHRTGTGLWITALYNYFDVVPLTPRTPPLNGERSLQAGRSTFPREDLTVVLPTTLPDGQAGLFRVSTPYVMNTWDEDLKEQSLPFLSGTRIGAIRVREANPDSELYGVTAAVELLPEANQFPEPGDPEPLAPHHVGRLLSDRQIGEFSRPILEYWLVADDNNVPRATKPFAVRSDYELRDIPQEVQIKTREAFGLSGSATDQEVLEQARAKSYSFTPYADSNQARSATVRSNDTFVNLGAVAALAAAIPNANCNTTALSVLAATGGVIDGQPVNEAAGYRSTDGRTLTLGGSHTWLYDAEGRTIDATPSLASEQTQAVNPHHVSVERNSTGNSAQTLLFSAALLAMGAGAIRQRKQLRELSMQAARIPLRLELQSKADRFDRALTAIEGVLFARPYAPLPVAEPRGETMTRLARSRYADPLAIRALVRNDERIRGQLEHDAVRLLTHYAAFTQVARDLVATGHDTAVKRTDTPARAQTELAL